VARTRFLQTVGVVLRVWSVVAAHPRHVVLAGLVAGLLLGPSWPPGVLAAALAGLVLPGRFGVGLCAAMAVLGGAALADARLTALDGGALPLLQGTTVQGAGVLLEPMRQRRSGVRAGRVQLRGEVAAARVGREVEWPGGLEVGEEVLVHGRIAPLSPAEAYQRPRGARVALVVTVARRAGRRRGGLAGDIDAIRRRSEHALSAGLQAPQAGLLRGMVLGQDEGLAEPVREEFRRSGLAHLTAASGQNVMLLAILAIAAATALGAGLRIRLGVALVLVLLYVPLAGGGPSIQRAGVMGAAGLVAALAGRPASRWYALGLAAAATLAINPRAAQEPGWQLSFAAVIALLALAPRLQAGLVRHGCPPALADATAITVAATLGTAPLMALHFEAVSLASLPATSRRRPRSHRSCGSGCSRPPSGRFLGIAVELVAKAAAEPHGDDPHAALGDGEDACQMGPQRMRVLRRRVDREAVVEPQVATYPRVSRGAVL
jgi:competence protein ComEC